MAEAELERGAQEMSEGERGRVTVFVIIEVFFLLVSPLAGGFQYKMWSMLDSAILIASIGLTGLLFVLEEKSSRKLVFKGAVVLYVLAVLDMSMNVLVSGWVGWGKV